MTPSEIEAAVRPLLTEAASLEKKAKELRALASDYEEKLTLILGSAKTSADLTLNDLLGAIRKKNGRAKDYADRLGVPVSVIERLISQSDEKIYPDGRGWLKIREDLQRAA